MATSGKSLPHRMQRWHHATEGARDLLADLPFIQEELEELRDIAAEIQGLKAQHAYHLAQSQSLTAKIRRGRQEPLRLRFHRADPMWLQAPAAGQER